MSWTRDGGVGGQRARPREDLFVATYFFPMVIGLNAFGSSRTQRKYPVSRKAPKPTRRHAMRAPVVKN